MKNSFKFIDLFSGIGGFHLPLSELGGNCVLASEINESAISTYKSNFGLMPKGDIKTIEIDTIPEFDLLCGGFPCQSFSNIGNKKGIEDERGELVLYIFNILRNKKPKAFILENVKGLLTNNRGLTFKFILNSLEELGYDVYYEVLNATDFGLPQIRQRLFFVGVRKDLKIPFKFPNGEGCKVSLSSILGGTTNREFAYTIRVGGRLSGINNKFNWDSYIVNGEVKVITPEQCLLLQGFPDNFVLSGTKTQKYKQVGNAVPTVFIRSIAIELIKRGII